jgi:hypothetical protein
MMVVAMAIDRPAEEERSGPDLGFQFFHPIDMKCVSSIYYNQYNYVVPLAFVFFLSLTLLTWPSPPKSLRIQHELHTRSNL